MKTRILIFCMMAFMSIHSIKAVNVTLTTDEGLERTTAITQAEKNLAQVLTEINLAQKAHEVVSVKDKHMNEFAQKSLARLWAVTPFYCDDEELVERIWVFKDGTMSVFHIPLIIMPEDEEFGQGEYQDAIVEFDKDGRITDFRFALDSHTRESMERCGSIVEKEQQMIILQYVERFRTAYNQKDLKTIEAMFSDDALIITGQVVVQRPAGDNNKYSSKIEYTRQNKQQYISRLQRAFIRNKWIDVKFDLIGDNGESSNGCAGITRSNVDPTKYGVRLHQSWKSSNYSDEGYLFLLWEFPEDGGAPIIHIRTWQPKWVDGQKQEPDVEITTLGGFNL